MIKRIVRLVSFALLVMAAVMVAACGSQAVEPSGSTGTTPGAHNTPQPTSQSAGRITEFALPTQGSGPFGITKGPDGNIWFTERYGPCHIGRITPTGKIKEFPQVLCGALDITAGPDGNLWFTEETGRIGRITPGGVTTDFLSNDDDFWGYQHVPTDITTGPDGNLWFKQDVSNGFSEIVRITPAGQLTEFLFNLPKGPGDITAGPDGNLWFTEDFKIGRITTGK